MKIKDCKKIVVQNSYRYGSNILDFQLKAIDKDSVDHVFVYNKNIYGVQFHPEFTWDVTKALMDARIKNGIKVDNVNLKKSLKGNKILHNFIDLVQESETE